MTFSTRVLMEGTLKYMGTHDGRSYDWMSARVFVLEYDPPFGGGDAMVSVVAREPMYLHRIPSPAGTIHVLRAYDESDGLGYEGEGDLLILDTDLVPA